MTTDSRQCPSGSLFFALRGENFDGNRYAASALEKGCSLAVVDDVELSGKPGMFYVEDVLVALQQLANHHRRVLGLPIIGITGSNGKTTTKELVASVLSMKYKVYYTQGNLNNHIGVPLTLLSMNKHTQIGVVEMGANHPGEIAELCRIAEPDFGVITNVGKAHIEGFGSFEGVRQTKGELYDFIRATNGTLFVNADDDMLMKMSDHLTRVTYGVNDNAAEVQGRNMDVNPFLLFQFRSGVNANWHDVQSKMVGKYNISNFLVAAAIGQFFQVDDIEVAWALSSYVPENNRSQLINGVHNRVLMDAYNANPSSMQVALENFKDIRHPFKVAIIGAMKELGHISDEEHKKVVRYLLGGAFHLVCLVGEEFETVEIESNMAHRFAKVDDLVAWLKDHPLKDAFVLVKGSRGNKLEQALPYLQ
ncbi:UDP-N-acetylmuramoyl-tripeptide--D-alanyl-D-alanine ligase [Breznakibacter xylanolyticus]|uniref:UDP-N-acetylmuramoyl-tripeptide--D-alanyl-D- alanine ligase n=1 Tax=Breznakibacter xylanolyticus TaxID=990 RepID=UPI001FE24CBB|nr:UDP-N-acetylmuramoyl-tripeptide--D-alanyl-D-alanine ligase [Breznakibacter xylanolyticus]